MSEKFNLSAYWYSFEPTGITAIDRILAAVAHAGKAHHNTIDWSSSWDKNGKSEEKRIQDAANLSAREWNETKHDVNEARTKTQI